MGRIRERSVAARILFWIEGKLCREAAAVIVLFAPAKAYVAALGVPPDRIHCLPNGTELPPYVPAPERPFTLMYFGAHGDSNALDVALRALALLKDRQPSVSVRCRFVGAGPAKPALIELAKQLGLDNVEFEPAVPRAQVPALAAEADAFIASQRNLPNLYRFGISLNKLYDYLAAGRPAILASGATGNVVAESGGGMVVEPENPAALAEAIARIAGMSAAERRAMGEKGRRYVEENHSYAVLGARFARILDGLLPAADRLAVR
jgi:glycosyltransferase involved in cell wall biosynthesis